MGLFVNFVSAKSDQGVPLLVSETSTLPSKVEVNITSVQMIYYIDYSLLYYPPEVSSIKYCHLGVFRKEYFRLITK